MNQGHARLGGVLVEAATFTVISKLGERAFTERHVVGGSSAPSQPLQYYMTFACDGLIFTMFDPQLLNIYIFIC